MKDFTDVIVDSIISKERVRIDNIMKEVTMNIQKDFAKKMYELLDEYYENYDPIRYVRVYGKRGKYMKNRKPKGGQVSLHAAITRGGIDSPAIGYVGGDYDNGYYGGISFNPDYFTGRDNNIRHIGKGKNFTEWNIVENFLFAGQGGYGDIRSYIDYSYPSADTEMQAFMDAYGPTFDRHYQNALKHNKNK